MVDELICVETLRDRRDFLALPKKIYHNDPNWTPPLQGQVEELVGWKRHAFYEHAESQAFLVRRHGEAVGRILAIQNFAHNKRYQDGVGFFGFFESINDQQVADQLLDAARNWLFDRQLQCVRGPVSPSLHHECGLLATGFDAAPFFMTPYNPSYYVQLLKGHRCQKVKDLLAYIFFASDIPRLMEDYEQRWKTESQAAGFRVRSYTRKSFKKDLLSFVRLYNDTLEGLWGTVPMTEAEIRDITGALSWLLVPELTAFVEKEGVPVGVVAGLLDFNPIIRKIGGKLFPFGLVHLLRHRRQIRRVRLFAAHIDGPFQDAGLGAMLIAALLPAMHRWNFEEMEVSWTLEDNRQSRRSLERAGGQLYKRFRIYEYS